MMALAAALCVLRLAQRSAARNADFMARQSWREWRGDQDEAAAVPERDRAEPAPTQAPLMVPPCDRRGAAIGFRRIDCPSVPASVQEDGRYVRLLGCWCRNCAA